MTSAEAQRQKLLKRLFPALAILVVYFTFIGPRLNAQVARGGQNTQKLREAYFANQTRLKDRAQQRKVIQAELAALQQQNSRVDAKTVRDISFMAQEDYAGKAIARLSVVLSQYRLHVIEDGRQEWESAKDGMPKSVHELGEPAKTTAGKSSSGGPGAALWRVRFSGTYPDVYRALDGLARDPVVIIPVSLDMFPPEGGGEMEWVLRIWI